MTFPNLATSARNLGGAQRVLLIAVLLLLSMVTGYYAATISTDTGMIAAWWPASGINVVAAIAVAKRYRMPVLALIAVTTALVSIAAGRPVVVAIITAVAVAIEAGIVTAFAVRADDAPKLTRMNDVARLFSGILIGTTVMGVIGAGAIALLGEGDFLALAFAIIASHASAIAVIAPVALVSRLVKPTAKRRFQAGHAVLLASSIAVSFAPGSIAPLGFLPVPFLAWAAFSFSMSFALFELLGASALVVLLTALKGGPFAAVDHGVLDSDALLQLYVLTLSITTLLIAAARNERQQLEEEKSATARLLHDGFELSENGFALVQEQNGSFRLMEVNSAALALLESSFTAAGTLTDDSPLQRLFVKLFASPDDELTELWDDDETHPIPATITVSRATNSTFGEIVLVSIVDLRPVRAAEASITLQLEREQAVVEKLKALSQRQDDFVSSVTHELRTPVSTVIGFSEELEATPLTEEQSEYVTIIQRNAERLRSVIEDVLTFSRLEPGASNDAAVAVDLAQLISSSLDDLRHAIRDKNLTIVNGLADGEVIVCAVPNDLTRVVINLVTNAGKFTPVAGTITFSAASVAPSVSPFEPFAFSDTPEMIALTMTDTGPGISPDDLDRVFDRFYRATRSTQDGVPGTGLGLSIVRELVTAMNGTITLDSDGVSGTTATVALPAHRPSATVSAAATDLQ